MSVPSWGIQQLLMQREEEQRRLQQAQQTMHAGFAPGGNNIFGLLAGVASAIAGKKRAGEAQGRLDENLKAIFDEQNKEAQARMEAEQRKRQEQYEDAIRVYSEKAKIDAANRPPEKLGFKERAFEMLSPQEQAAALKNEFGLGPKAGPAPSELEKRLILAQRMGATPEQMQALVLGQSSGQGVPSGYRQAAGGALEPIPGGPADKPREVDTKAAAAAQARGILDQIDGMLQRGEAWTGPADQYLTMAGEGRQKFETAVNQLVNPFQTLTRVPGQGAQSDLELKQLMSTFPTAGARESVNRQSIQNLRTYLDRLQGGAQGTPQQGAQPASPPAGAAVGSIITAPDGRRYRIIGGDPNDPDVEPVS